MLYKASKYLCIMLLHCPRPHDSSSHTFDRQPHCFFLMPLIPYLNSPESVPQSESLMAGGPWEAGTIKKGYYKSCWQLCVSTGVVCDLCRQSKSQKYTAHYPINPLTCCCLAIISFPQRWEGRGEATAPHRQIVLWYPWMIWGEPLHPQQMLHQIGPQ